MNRRVVLKDSSGSVVYESVGFYDDDVLEVVFRVAERYGEFVFITEDEDLDIFDTMAASRYCMLHYLPPSYRRLLTSDERQALADCQDNVQLLMQVWPPIKDRIDRIYCTTP